MIHCDKQTNKESVIYEQNILFIFSDGSVLVDLWVEAFLLEFQQQIVLKLSVDIDFALCFLVLVESFVDAVFGEQLWISALVDVVKNC